jgi:hypothetical protein
MALSRFVLTATVTVPAGTPTADANGFGLVTWAGNAGPPVQWSAGSMPITFTKGQVILADSAGGSSTAAQQLYNAIGGNLRAFVDG